MYEFECLTQNDVGFAVNMEECSPFLGACIENNNQLNQHISVILNGLCAFLNQEGVRIVLYIKQ